MERGESSQGSWHVHIHGGFPSLNFFISKMEIMCMEVLFINYGIMCFIYYLLFLLYSGVSSILISGSLFPKVDGKILEDRG